MAVVVQQVVPYYGAGVDEVVAAVYVAFVYEISFAVQ